MWKPRLFFCLALYCAGAPASVRAEGDLKYIDASGTIHFVDTLLDIPPQFRNQVKEDAFKERVTTVTTTAPETTADDGAEKPPPVKKKKAKPKKKSKPAANTATSVGATTGPGTATTTAASTSSASSTETTPAGADTATGTAPSAEDSGFAFALDPAPLTLKRRLADGLLFQKGTAPVAPTLTVRQLVEKDFPLRKPYSEESVKAYFLGVLKDAGFEDIEIDSCHPSAFGGLLGFELHAHGLNMVAEPTTGELIVGFLANAPGGLVFMAVGAAPRLAPDDFDEVQHAVRTIKVK